MLLCTTTMYVTMYTGKEERCNEEWCNEEWCNEERCNEEWCNEEWCNEEWCNEERCNEERCNEERCNEEWCNEEWCNAQMWTYCRAQLRPQGVILEHFILQFLYSQDSTHQYWAPQNSNMLSAILCLIKEIDGPSLEVVELAARSKHTIINTKNTNRQQHTIPNTKYITPNTQIQIHHRWAHPWVCLSDHFPVLVTSPHHSDQMSERAQVSSIAPRGCFLY